MTDQDLQDDQPVFPPMAQAPTPGNLIDAIESAIEDYYSIETPHNKLSTGECWLGQYMHPEGEFRVEIRVRKQS